MKVKLDVIGMVKKFVKKNFLKNVKQNIQDVFLDLIVKEKDVANIVKMVIKLKKLECKNVGEEVCSVSVFKKM